ncbi:hypothetical protein NDU88_002182 [Pleurodeles waltl]|uniref:Uncharacterized protein n=1 Tax=Pleurodeles waltl TaxID=8319 RepID=A0AAV7U8J7_PLEWA|nr:hypothetical protein NDU88_002182 [Pleurodeles waltl]
MVRESFPPQEMVPRESSNLLCMAYDSFRRSLKLMPTLTQYISNIRVGSTGPFQNLVGEEGLAVWEASGVSTLGTLFHNGALILFGQLRTDYELPAGHFLSYRQIAGWVELAMADY